MLVLLLVASLMANIDITQLETTEVIEEVVPEVAQMQNSLPLLHRKKPSATQSVAMKSLLVKQRPSKSSFKTLETKLSPNLATKPLFGLLT